MPNEFPFITKRHLFPAVQKITIARAAKAAQLHFLKSFDKSGFTDQTLKVWDRQRHPTGRRTLVGKQARLKKSIRIRRMSKKSALIGTRGIAYANIQNEGGTTHPTVTDKMRGFAWNRFRETASPRWKAIALTKKEKLTVKIPKRQFVGRSDKLDRKTCRIIANEFKKIFT